MISLETKNLISSKKQWGLCEVSYDFPIFLYLSHGFPRVFLWVSHVSSLPMVFQSIFVHRWNSYLKRPRSPSRSVASAASEVLRQSAAGWRVPAQALRRLTCKVVPPARYKLVNIIPWILTDISTIGPSYWSYKQIERYLGGTILCHGIRTCFLSWFFYQKWMTVVVRKST